MSRARAIPATLTDVSLIAGLSASGMILLFALIYVTSALGGVDLLLF